MVALQSIDAYGNLFQIKVISSLLTHKKFLINIHDIINESYFPNPAHQWIINQIL